MSKPKGCEIVIAVDKPRNGNVYFYPTNCAVEGTFKPWRTPGADYDAPIRGLEIPGERIHLDVKGKTGRISHAMADPENAGLLDRVRRAARQCKKHVIPCGEKPKDDRWFRNLTDEQVNTWLFWMRRLVDEGKATILQGQLPGMDELKSRKDILRPSYDSRARGGRYYQFEKTEPAGV